MNKSLYGKLAVTNIKNNRKTYIPYILTAMMTVMMYFIMDSLCCNDYVGNGSLQSVLQSTVGIITLFSVIFLFYTNSFLMKQRKKEIGVYHILGMGKGHLGKMLAWETFLVGTLSIAGGLAAGLIFSRLMFLILLKILHSGIRMEFQIHGISVVHTLLLFVGIFLLTLLYNLLQIRLSSPLELLQGSRKGEREPRTKWLLALISLGLLGVGYYIANTTESPMAALFSFFVAVLCVVLGTYGLFIAGSIAVLKLLRRNKKFYYQTRHFVAVSGMIYRMKQNAVGLSNICILSTMVLVLLSTSVSMYVGMDDLLANRFPFDVEIQNISNTPEDEVRMEEIIREELDRYQVERSDELVYHYAGFSAVMNMVEGNAGEDSYLRCYLNGMEDYTVEGLSDFVLVPLEDYNRIEGKDLTLARDEILLSMGEGARYGGEKIQMGDEMYRVVEEPGHSRLSEHLQKKTVETYFIVMSNEAEIQKNLARFYGVSLESEDWSKLYQGLKYQMYFNLEGDAEQVTDAMTAIREELAKEIPAANCGGRELSRSSFYVLYGGLLFIGIYLGLLFLMITVLIIYYKQISEGYEDKERYQIMQKVGMSLKEVRSSIRSQILMVFFLPLVMAVIHIVAGFKVITLLLAVLNLTNVALFFWCTVITVAVFGIIYAIVYAVTAREYYRIVR